MAPSTPPPAAEPSSATTNTTRPLFQNPPRPQTSHPFYSPSPPRLPSNPNPNYPQLAPRPPHLHPHPQDPSHLLYPVASSGRGFLSRSVGMPAGRAASPRPPFMFPYLDQGGQGLVRPNHFSHMLLGSGSGPAANASGGGLVPGVVKGIPIPHHSKAGPTSASMSDNNGHKDLRNMNKDDAFVTVKYRRVRVSEDASLYTLCRSWLRNGFPEETQPPYLDTVRALPRPLPAASQNQLSDSSDKKAEDKEQEDEDKDSVEHLSERELLQRHISRAKRVRSRLREERLQRISRYKTRLALLLPPMVEQHFKNESSGAN
ncbi:uncharacterized protein LOC127246493 isoform X2 [Andrographis paniculata]|uniref:uncharacterized protein LOC127246493 isoform X2 n=1 Tax=Andrographis paniculata TaxID=175694 RepID=UPI0021E96CF2|nr:uncharacterized protein LOC127246493 isoform X2 [Andrographis paniculata]